MDDKIENIKTENIKTEGSQPDTSKALNDIIAELAASSPYRIVFSQGEGKYKKAVINKTKDDQYQIERFTEKQAFHENIKSSELKKKILEVLKDFKQLNSFSMTCEIGVKITKKGKVLINRKKLNPETVKTAPKISFPGNNKKKNYLIPEGTFIEPLYDMGIFTKEGRVVSAMQDKYRQINRFIEILDDVIGTENEINIIDFGCGKSYLTFIVYYYLTEIKHIKANILGLDLKEDVIKKCNQVAKKYKYDGLRFELGDINGYKTTARVDMVITLHACDTATDYALYNAVLWNAKYILSVPCCQHEVNKTISNNTLSAMMKYGIIKERLSALATDSLRGTMLETKGYKTQLLEFVDFEDSPKNILIRAVKTNVSKEKRERSMEEAKKMCDFFEVEPTIYKLLK